MITMESMKWASLERCGLVLQGSFIVRGKDAISKVGFISTALRRILFCLSTEMEDGDASGTTSAVVEHGQGKDCDRSSGSLILKVPTISWCHVGEPGQQEKEWISSP